MKEWIVRILPSYTTKSKDIPLDFEEEARLLYNWFVELGVKVEMLQVEEITRKIEANNKGFK